MCIHLFIFEQKQTTITKLVLTQRIETTRNYCVNFLLIFMQDS